MTNRLSTALPVAPPVFVPSRGAGSPPSSPLPPPPPAPLPPPRLRPWSSIWRYLVAAGVGLFLLVFVIGEFLGLEPENLPFETSAIIGAILIVDFVFGVVSLCLLPLRRRWPVLTATLTGLLSSVSAMSIGSATIAAVSLSTRRRWKSVLAVGVVWVFGAAFYELVVRPAVPTTTAEPMLTWLSISLGVAVYALCASTGFYIGARRDLITSLQERAETAEREQALREESARESERTRIAREMHDVLAHHISLVSLHAGALTYRTDLTRDQTAEAAAVIQNNAQLALTELRQILGVLRTSQVTDGIAEPPQPTLRELPALLADAREAGMPVTMDAAGLAFDTDASDAAPLDGLPAVVLPEVLSRTAYRIIQESLTNARKHADGAAVSVTIAAAEGELRIEVRNGVGGRAGRGGAFGSALAAGEASTMNSDARNPAIGAGSGMGLTGLRERAALAGGTLEHGIDAAGDFVVKASLPWR
ncbi:sensor histidine kinase [Marisediminicola senii]|uniref:sensor histidine kinase n=1 Tax=Marisediminicola senii TaxID=2711233 RepID=UPI001F1B52EA|nr:histidine kinase [Marisediminicola senii]